MSATKILETSVVADGDSFPTNMPNRSFQVTVKGTGAVTAQIVVEYSNDREVWFAHDGSPADLSGTDLASKMLPIVNAGYGWIRARCTAITGTDAVASCTMAMM